MKYSLLVSAVIFALVTPPFSAHAEAADESNGVDSKPDTEIVIYHAKWCGPCRAYERNLKSTGNLQSITVDLDNKKGVVIPIRRLDIDSTREGKVTKYVPESQLRYDGKAVLFDNSPLKASELKEFTERHMNAVLKEKKSNPPMVIPQMEPMNTMTGNSSATIAETIAKIDSAIASSVQTMKSMATEINPKPMKMNESDQLKNPGLIQLDREHRLYSGQTGIHGAIGLQSGKNTRLELGATKKPLLTGGSSSESAIFSAAQDEKYTPEFSTEHLLVIGRSKENSGEIRQLRSDGSVYFKALNETNGEFKKSRIGARIHVERDLDLKKRIEVAASLLSQFGEEGNCDVRSDCVDPFWRKRIQPESATAKIKNNLVLGYRSGESYSHPFLVVEHGVQASVCVSVGKGGKNLVCADLGGTIDWGLIQIGLGLNSKVSYQRAINNNKVKVGLQIGGESALHVDINGVHIPNRGNVSGVVAF